MQIQSHKEFAQVMVTIDDLIQISDERLTKKQADKLKRLALAAQNYERAIYAIKPSSTFSGEQGNY